MATARTPVVAALDLGTSFSGYAFAFTSAPEYVYMNKCLGKDHYRTETSVLTEKGSRGKYVNFGHSAQTMYVKSLSPEVKKSYELYDNFKMVLYHEKKLSLDQKIKSVGGTERKLLDIFVMLIEALVDNLMSELKTKDILDIDQIRWVVTVSAIWSDAAKQFMEKATAKANLPEAQTLFLCEPEAASLHCNRLGINNFYRATHRYFGKDDFNFNIGKCYILIDAGGGTVDVTVHEIIGDNKVKEVYKTTGGPWGGTQVNVRFLDLLENALGRDFIERFKQDHPVNWQDFMRTFERQKRLAQMNSGISINIPAQMERSFRKLGFGELDEQIAKTSHETDVTESNGFLSISSDATKKLFEPVTETIISHVQSLLQNRVLKKIDYIFLVGGFGDSPYLKEAMQDRFEEYFVLIPDEPEFAVVRGAVKYGLDPTIIKSRKAKRTYGVSTMVQFNKEKHDHAKKVIHSSKDWCKDYFLTFIREGDDIESNTMGYTIVSPVNESHSYAKVTFHSISRKVAENEVLYTDSAGVDCLGDIIVDFNQPFREATLELFFGETIIRASAKPWQGMAQKVEINFMTK